MTYGDLQPCLVGQVLEFHFPQTRSVAIAPTGVCTHQQAVGLRVGLPSHATPPPPNTLHRETGRVVVVADIDPTLVSSHVEHSVGERFPHGAVREVMSLNGFRLAFRLPFLAAVLVGAHEFFFLGIDGNRWVFSTGAWSGD